MSKIDKSQMEQVELGGEDRETESMVKKSKKKKKASIGCFVIFLIIIILIFGFSAWTLAASGMVNVPGFSSLAFKSPEPTRIVVPGTLLEKEIEAAVNANLFSKKVSIDLSEESITASLQKGLKDFEQDFIISENAQIVVTNEGLELFLPIANSKQDSAVVARLFIYPTDGVFAVEIKEVRFGSLRIPKIIIDKSITPLLQKGVDSLNEAFAKTAEVESVTFSNGFVTLSGQLKL
ncbi:MAG: hypothetical protein ABIH21_02905 [Patescibacteria group bacterium]